MGRRPAFGNSINVNNLDKRPYPDECVVYSFSKDGFFTIDHEYSDKGASVVWTNFDTTRPDLFCDPKNFIDYMMEHHVVDKEYADVIGFPYYKPTDYGGWYIVYINRTSSEAEIELNWEDAISISDWLEIFTSP